MGSLLLLSVKARTQAAVMSMFGTAIILDQHNRAGTSVSKVRDAAIPSSSSTLDLLGSLVPVLTMDEYGIFTLLSRTDHPTTFHHGGAAHGLLAGRIPMRHTPSRF